MPFSTTSQQEKQSYRKKNVKHKNGEGRKREKNGFKEKCKNSVQSFTDTDKKNT